MIATVVIFLMVVVSVFYLIQPMARRLPWTFGKGRGLMHLQERKEAALRAIHDIDFEYAAGRLSEEEYRELREAFKREAIAAMKEIDMDLEPPKKVRKDLHEAVKREVMRLKREMVLSVLLILLLPLGLYGAEVTVRIHNGTTKAPQGDVPVSLYVLEREKEAHKVREKLEGVTDPKGVVTFEVEGGEGVFAMPLVEYRGIPYRGRGIDLGEDRDQEVSITVYELSDEEGLVEIKERSVFVEGVRDGMISIVDMVVISNRGDKTYVGRFNEDSKMTETVRIGLPYGYERPTLDGPVDLEEVVSMTNGLVLKEAIPPGDKTLWLTYRVRSEIGRFDLEYPVTTPYGVFRFYFPSDVDWRVRVKNLERDGQIELQGKTFVKWEGRDIGRNVTSDDDSMPYILAPKITLYDPARYRLIGRNEVAILLALVSSVAAGLIYVKRGRARERDEAIRAMEEERVRLATLIGRLKEEIEGDSELEGFYRPYIDLLSKRVEEIDLIIGHSRGKA